jgi:replication-associated recombination protein RarA
MIPQTIHAMPSLVVLSALQKYVRLADEENAMLCACELIHTSKNFFTMVCNRLEIISHEDIDTQARPDVVPFVYTAVQQAKALWDPQKPGRARMPLGNAIRLMCRAAKSREGDHFQAVCGLGNLLEKRLPTIPDSAYDKHTPKGKQMGRGFDHFRKEGAKLVNYGSFLPVTEDRYADECYRLWALKEKLEREGEP